MEAAPKRLICAMTKSESTSSFSSSAMRAALSRSFISAAADRVKVSTSRASTLVFSSTTIRRIRSMSSAVLPEPAAADTSRFFFLVSMALS